MDPTSKSHEQSDSESISASQAILAAPPSAPQLRESYDLHWMIIGPDGVRAGWLILLFYCLFRLFLYLFGGLFFAAFTGVFQTASPLTVLLSELIEFFAMIAAGALMIAVAHRKPGEYNLRGPRPVLHLAGGLVIGFLTLSALVGALAIGGWLHFGPAALSGTRIFGYAAIWGVGFLIVGCVEEGTFRCYGLATLVRGINFWWALASISGLCLYARFFAPGESTLGVYIFAALGVIPCFLLHFRKAAGSNFWQAAWATSTGFGFVHTSNGGENWIGIFAAASIGFVFCVSVRLTGSAWWAIGCHAAWDWAETYFYGTADSGFVAPGHLFTTAPAGNPLWSGGSDGPEGSLLIIPIILLLLACLLVLYRRPRPAAIPAPAQTEQLAS